jgi:hypothetical protein
MSDWKRRKKTLAATGLHEGKKQYCKLKEEAIDRTLWKNCAGRGCELVIRQTAECLINEDVVN